MKVGSRLQSCERDCSKWPFKRQNQATERTKMMMIKALYHLISISDRRKIVLVEPLKFQPLMLWTAINWSTQRIWISNWSTNRVLTQDSELRIRKKCLSLIKHLQRLSKVQLSQKDRLIDQGLIPARMIPMMMRVTRDLDSIRSRRKTVWVEPLKSQGLIMTMATSWCTPTTWTSREPIVVMFCLHPSSKWKDQLSTTPARS